MTPATLRRLLQGSRPGIRQRSPLACLGAAMLAMSPALSHAATVDTAPIAALNAALATVEKDAAKPFPVRYAVLAPAIDAAFNLPQILHTIIGLRYAAIPPDNQAKLLAAFRAFTVASYAANFNTDSNDQFKILPETRAVGADTVVETEIVPKDGGDHTRIDYVMRQFGPTWQAVDVLQQGTISQAAVQRSDFRSLLSDGTGAALIASLTQRVDKLSGGTVHP